MNTHRIALEWTRTSRIYEDAYCSNIRTKRSKTTRKKYSIGVMGGKFLDKKTIFHTHREREKRARSVIEKKISAHPSYFANCLWAITHILIIAWGFREWRITLDYHNRVVTLVFVMFYTQNKDIHTECVCSVCMEKTFRKQRKTTE